MRFGMKRSIIFTIVCVLVCLVGFAQNTTVIYYYDDCGNRIERTMGFKKVEENGRLLEANNNDWLAKVEENFDGISLALYPNPTNGKFSLAISEEMSSLLLVELFNEEGAIIERRRVKGLSEEFDLTGKTAGIYMFRLTYGEKTRTWKIIKTN